MANSMEYHTKIEINRFMGLGLGLTVDLSFKGDVSELYPNPVFTFYGSDGNSGYYAPKVIEHIAVIDRANTGNTIGTFLALYPFTDNLVYIQEFEMNQLQKLAYYYMSEQGACTAEEFQNAAQCSKATAQRVLHEMVDSGYAEFVSVKNKRLYALSAKGSNRLEKMPKINPDTRFSFIVGTESEEE